VKAGARLAAGGRPPAAAQRAGGYYVAPTLMDGVDAASPLAQEEVFGPVVAMIEFADDAEALAIANGTDYGLVAGVWTRDLPRALSLARELQAGQIHVNGYAVGGNAHLPFGGYRRSGVGRVKGVAGALEYTQLKTIAVTTA
jgi:acyl-CoA reductase-like NAD-dependent aldehyde dehydrogenase